MSVLAVSYGVFLTPENIDGTSHVFACPTGAGGDGSPTLETRVITTGKVLALEMSGENCVGTIYKVTDGPLNKSDQELEPGDIIVTTCEKNDIEFQSGSLAVILNDGTLAGYDTSLFIKVAAILSSPIMDILTDLQDRVTALEA